MQTEEMQINGFKYVVNLTRHNRRNSTVSIKDNIITIKLSNWAAKNEKEKHLTEFLEWARKRIEKEPERFRPPKIRKYEDNDMVRIGDEKYVLSIRYSNRKSGVAKAIGNIIKITLPENAPADVRQKMTSNLLAKVIAQKRLPGLHDRLNLLNNMFFRKEIKNIRFRNMTSRWGSCTKDGRISISTRLLLAPDNILEYVCIHELAHLVHFDHSKRYWELVEKVLPDYKKRERWLSENGKDCIF